MSRSPRIDEAGPTEASLRKPAMPFTWRASLAAATALLAACGGAFEGPGGADAIALVDGEPVAAQELDAYLRFTLGDEAEESTDEVKSELLDQLLVYRLVEKEALENGQRVGREEVERRLRELGLEDGGPEGEPLPEGFLRQLRRSILVDRYLAETVVGSVDVTAEDLAEARASGGEEGAGPLVVYRQAMTQTLEEAKAFLERVQRDREPFAQVAADVSISPDGAEPQLARVGQLPPEVGQALGGGPKGGLVGPVAVECGIEEAPDACRYYVFLIEDRDDFGRPAGRTDEEIRESVRRAKQAELLDRYLEELRASRRIEVRPGRLPFRYSRPGSGEVPS